MKYPPMKARRIAARIMGRFLSLAVLAKGGGREEYSPLPTRHGPLQGDLRERERGGKHIALWWAQACVNGAIPAMGRKVGHTAKRVASYTDRMSP
jgi:hypothetical protein